jgi:integrase
VARLLNRLSDRAINSTKINPGRHADGGGLYLVVDRPGGKDAAKRWVFLYRKDGRLREMGLGGLLNVPIAKARVEAEKWRTVLGDRASRGDPIAERKRVSGGIPTFGDFADKFLDAKEAGWRNDKHRAQWRMTLTEYAASLRRKPVNDIGTEDVLSVLKRIWTEKPETAARLRGRIERVLDAARAAGHRTGENPARWRGHLDHLLSKRQKLSRGHHAAMPYDEVAAFVAGLRERPAGAARALEFTILTAARSGEALAARWDEIDFDAKLWTIPAGRMKAAREHRVPLSDRGIAILREMETGRTGEYVFPGQRPRRPLSNMRLRCCCAGSIRLTPLTAFDLHFATGRATRRLSRARWLKLRSLMPSATRPRLLIVAPMRWRSAESSWMHGRPSARRRPLRLFNCGETQIDHGQEERRPAVGCW